METQRGTIKSIYEEAGEYVETRLELLKLQAISKSSDVTSSVVSGLAVFIFAIFAFIFVNIGLALWIGELLESSYLGFFILTAFYALIAVLLHSFRKTWIKDPITTMLIKKMLN
ncbi:MAG: phage holin family protein [Bacteroidota bacterium]|nr:phage holin family protein [Ferruginibacter sp.]